MKKFLLLTAIACTAAVSAVAPAMAGDDDAARVGGGSGSGTVTTESVNLVINAEVLKFCSTPTVADAPSNVTGYDGREDKTDTSKINFRCTKGTSGTVKLSKTSGQLVASGTSDKLNYSVSLGNTGVQVGRGLTNPGTLLESTATVTVPKNQDVTAGKTYSDTIGISISY
jgi:spore coat protein U-like protein